MKILANIFANPNLPAIDVFFLEAGFLGVMLFGWHRVGPGLHMFATSMVALGTLISATWIIASNSWMQTPQGHAIIDGRVVPVDWLAVIFNPSFPYRLLHMSVAAFLATAMVALGTLISATWIIASNSWMQTPQGHAIIDGRIVCRRSSLHRYRPATG